MTYSMWLRAALPGWPTTTPQHLPVSSTAITHCYDTAVSLTLELGFLTWTCSIKVRIWESGSACIPGSVPKTSSFLCKVKQIWLSNDNHMHGSSSLEGVVELVLSTAVHQSSCSCERLVESASVTCTQSTRAVTCLQVLDPLCFCCCSGGGSPQENRERFMLHNLSFYVVTSERLIRKTSQPFEVADKTYA